MNAVLVRNADKMMVAVEILAGGIEVAFADGGRGLLPWVDIPEVGNAENLNVIELPNPYQIILRVKSGEDVELPWDFVRHYCDSTYRPRVEAIAAEGRRVLGERIKRTRKSAGLTQEALAQSAGVGRVTLVRIESGEQSPRYNTLVSLARALGQPVGKLLTDDSLDGFQPSKPD